MNIYRVWRGDYTYVVKGTDLQIDDQGHGYIYEGAYIVALVKNFDIIYRESSNEK